MITDFDLIMDPSLDKFKDECGVFGIFSDKPMDTAGVTIMDYMPFSIEDRKVLVLQFLMVKAYKCIRD